MVSSITAIPSPRKRISASLRPYFNFRISAKQPNAAYSRKCANLRTFSELNSVVAWFASSLLCVTVPPSSFTIELLNSLELCDGSIELIQMNSTIKNSSNKNSFFIIIDMVQICFKCSGLLLNQWSKPMGKCLVSKIQISRINFV